MTMTMTQPCVRPKPAVGKPRITFEWELIDPVLAQLYLDERHPDQRRIRDHRVAQYVRDLQAGRWTPTSETIAFDVREMLVDGQHRLAAIVKAGVSVWVAVARGVPVESMANIGSGMQRSPSDAGRMAGHGNYTTGVLSCATAMMLGAKSRLLMNNRPTRAELFEFVEKYHDAIMFSQDIQRCSGVTRGVRAAVARAYLHVDRSRLQEWCAVLKSGMPVSVEPHEDSAAVVFRDFLFKKSGQSGAELETDRFQKTQSSIAYFVARRTMTKVYGSTDDLYPLPSPRD